MNNQKEFRIENYLKKPVFSSFLPGISGIRGIPAWCCYVNRGQGIAGFGLQDKDHGIMEFYPAHQAYQNVSVLGFRTFCRRNGTYGELLQDAEQPHSMKIYRNGLEIEAHHPDLGIRCNVRYYTLPGESFGGLVRKVTICNDTVERIELEVLDGMAALVPYGVDMESLKHMGQTVKAWMRVEKTAEGMPFFRVRASIRDTAVVSEVKGGNFGYAVTSEGEVMSWIADPKGVFSYDTSLQKAEGFREKGAAGLLHQEGLCENQFPCCFFGAVKQLEGGEEFTFYEVIGQVTDKRILEDFLARRPDRDYFEAKEAEAAQLTQELCEGIETGTARSDFDEYCRYTYMDNVLRGGFPILLPGGKVFYIYSRKHGDLERDYNYFRMLPEFYSQGNGNYRDVCQNRRMDNFFTPLVQTENIRRFYNLIQIDGYNPLSVERVTFALAKEKREAILEPLTKEQRKELQQSLSLPFTPGSLYQKLDDLLTGEERDNYFANILEQSQEESSAVFGEGYWSDHWTYNLDLVEAYLSLYPEKKQELLTAEEYTYYRSRIPILPRRKRYEKTDCGVRQYRFLDEEKEISGEEGWLRADYGRGNVVRVSLLEKLLVLCAAKYAALDAYAMGVEMEGGKPGWYDALNGLPALFGSGMAETCELSRNLHFVITALAICPDRLPITGEVARLLQAMNQLTLDYQKADDTGNQEKELLRFWERRNDYKESYWQETFRGISGEKTEMEKECLLSILHNLKKVVDRGIQRASLITGELYPTYFSYQITEYKEEMGEIRPLRFEPTPLPLFLEGAVRRLKLPGNKEEKLKLAEAVKSGDLYDRKLKMYKVNASLKDASFELGRVKAFTPGWLENESVWLHMEYKYLLALLKGKLYEQYLEDFTNVIIPFQNPEVYGRCIWENSSFIASSANPDPSVHGQGFVARLSGSTAEFLEMWKIMMFGDEIFQAEKENLSLTLAPCIPKSLIGEDRKIEAVFMGRTKVTYTFAERKDYIPGNYQIEEIKLICQNQDSHIIRQGTLDHFFASGIRNGEFREMYISIG